MRGALAGAGAAFGAANPVPCGMGSALAGAFAVFSAEIVRRARREQCAGEAPSPPQWAHSRTTAAQKNERRSAFYFFSLAVFALFLGGAFSVLGAGEPCDADAPCGSGALTGSGVGSGGSGGYCLSNCSIVTV